MYELNHNILEIFLFETNVMPPLRFHNYHQLNMFDSKNVDQKSSQRLKRLGQTQCSNSVSSLGSFQSRDPSQQYGSLISNESLLQNTLPLSGHPSWPKEHRSEGQTQGLILNKKKLAWMIYLLVPHFRHHKYPLYPCWLQRSPNTPECQAMIIILQEEVKVCAHVQLLRMEVELQYYFHHVCISVCIYVQLPHFLFRRSQFPTL